MSISNDTSGRKQAVAVRNIEFYRPEPDALPWALLEGGAARLEPDELKRELDLDYTRVACRIEPPETLGIYAMRRHSVRQFELISLCVVPDYEHQLLGRRLLGHALGLAESKAGREVELSVCSTNTRALEILQRYGFQPVAIDASEPDTPTAPPIRLRFELTEE